MPTVAVIGAGALGLMATKCLLDDGFSVTTYEVRDYVGGLWKDSHDSTLSVFGTTIFNSSKFRAAVSDFPFRDTDDVYPTAFQLHNYLESYAGHFNLWPSIKTGTKVLAIERSEGRWKVESENKKTGSRATEYFDKVLSATGSFYQPRSPKLEGLERFQGKVLHAIEYHESESFKNQNVLLIGMHATAQDITNSLSENAKKVYLAHRSGLLLLPRFDENGSPFDATTSLSVTMFMAWMTKNLPRAFDWIGDRMLNKMSSKAFPDIPKSWGLLPTPSMAVATPLMADTLWPFLKSGFAEPTKAVKEIRGPKEVELTDGRVLKDIDSIIYCTGYDFSIPKGLISETSGYHPYPNNGVGQPPHLYRNIFPLHEDPSICNSLAYLGQAGILFPGFAQFEIYAMAISQVFLGKTKLPPYREMLRWREDHLKGRAATEAKYMPKEGSTFYPSLLNFGEHFRWMDSAAGTGIYAHFGNAWFNWRAWRLWWNDSKLYRLCLGGLFTPAIWRLFDMGKRKPMDWDKCRDLILLQNEKARVDREERVRAKKAQ